MRPSVSWFLFAGLLGSMKPALADYDLVMKKNCLACHTLEKRKYGPSFKDVAAKYANDPKAADRLAKKIRAGGTGVWGGDIMPPQPQVSVAEARTLATYVLSVQ